MGDGDARVYHQVPFHGCAIDVGKRENKDDRLPQLKDLGTIKWNKTWEAKTM